MTLTLLHPPNLQRSGELAAAAVAPVVDDLVPPAKVRQTLSPPATPRMVVTTPRHPGRLGAAVQHHREGSVVGAGAVGVVVAEAGAEAAARVVRRQSREFGLRIFRYVGFACKFSSYLLCT